MRPPSAGRAVGRVPREGGKEALGSLYVSVEAFAAPGVHTSLLAVAEMTTQGTPASRTVLAEGVVAKLVPEMVSGKPAAQPGAWRTRDWMVGCTVFWKTAPEPSRATCSARAENEVRTGARSWLRSTAHLPRVARRERLAVPIC